MLGPIPGLPKIASFNFGTAAVSSGAITIPACKLLIIEYLVTGYSGAGDIASFRFNADSTGANYGSRFVAFSVAAPPVNSQVANAGTLGHIPVSGVSQTIGRRGTIRISNIAANRKVCVISNSNESTSSTSPSIEVGWGEWLNTTAQITSIDMRTSGGSITLSAGSGFVVYGDNF